MKNVLNEIISKQSEKNKENFQKVLEDIGMQRIQMESEIREVVDEKLYNQNAEVQKVEQLLTSKLSKQNEENRKAKEEIEKIKLRIEEVKLELENSTETVSRYEIEELIQKLKQIDKKIESSYTKQEITEIIEKEIKRKKAELEKENEEKIRKIVAEMLSANSEANDQKAQNEKKQTKSQILATFK